MLRHQWPKALLHTLNLAIFVKRCINLIAFRPFAEATQHPSNCSSLLCFGAAAAAAAVEWFAVSGGLFRVAEEGCFILVNYVS